MSVRKAAGTTFWLIVLFVGFSFLIPIIRSKLPSEIIYPLLLRLHPQYYTRSYFPFVVNLAMWAAVVVGTIDAILNSRCHFALLLQSYNVLIVMAIPVIITAVIPSVSLPMFWGVLQVAAVIGTYWTFRKHIHNNHKGGQKLIPFIKEIKILGGTPAVHISDHYAVWGTSLLLIGLYALQVVSLIVFICINWNSFI